MLNELQSLSDAVTGLLYPSESDEPFEVFRWPGNAAPTAVAAIQKNAKIADPLQEDSVDDFFQGLATSSDAARFAKLRQALNATLKELKLFRAGEVEVAVFLIGRTTTDDWAGVRTVSIET